LFASEILYEESVHAESNATPSIELVIVAAARFVLLFIFIFGLSLDSQLGFLILSVLVILVLFLILLFNKLLELLKTILFLAISISDFKLFIKFLRSLLIFVSKVRFLDVLLVDPIPYGHPLTPGAQVWLIGLPSKI
jgi:hypothetical protein